MNDEDRRPSRGAKMSKMNLYIARLSKRRPMVIVRHVEATSNSNYESDKLSALRLFTSAPQRFPCL